MIKKQIFLFDFVYDEMSVYLIFVHFQNGTWRKISNKFSDFWSKIESAVGKPRTSVFDEFIGDDFPVNLKVLYLSRYNGNYINKH